MINCDAIFGRKYISSYQEFYLALAVGAECGRQGITLDMSMMRITDPKLLSKHDMAYFQYLRSVGAVWNGSEPEKKFVRNSDDDLLSSRPVLWCDVDKFSELEGKLFYEENGAYHWKYDWAYKAYGDKYLMSITNRSSVGSTVMHLIGYMLVNFLQGNIEPKKIIFHFNRMEARSTYMYLPVYACIGSCENVKKFIELDFEEKRKELRDLDYYVIYESSRNAGLFTWHSWQEKLEAMKKMGIQEGSIAAMYKRAGMSANNPAGYIKEAKLVRIEDLSSAPFVSVQSLFINKTLEEQEVDYYEIEKEYRHLYSDMLDFRLPSSQERVNLFDVGVGSYFYTEEWILLPLDKSESVDKLITVDGQRVVRNMNGVEAIYWILSEYGYEFDRDLYKSMYNDGRPLLWDVVDGTPKLLSDSVENYE